MKTRADDRGYGREIPKRLWPDLQRLEREGKKQIELVAWLESECGAKVSVPTLSRLMAQIRSLAPPVEPDPTPALEPQTDEDELRTIRHLAREEMAADREPKVRIAAAGLLIRLRAERRATKAADRPAGQVGGDPADASAWTGPTFGVKPVN